MRESHPSRATLVVSAFGRPGRTAGLALAAGARAWRGIAPASKAGGLVLAGIGAAGLLLALVGLWMAWGAFAQARALSAWGRAPGLILASGIERGCGGDPTAYEAQVRYRYEVGGVVYVGERTALDGAQCGTERAARAAAARRRVDSTATVRYDPVRVSQSTLSVGETTWASGLGLVAMVTLAAASLGCTARGLRGRNQRGAHAAPVRSRTPEEDVDGQG